MHKIDTSTATSSSEFTDGNPSQGRKATQLNAAWFNAVQNEIINAITAAGLTAAASAAADATGGYAQLTAAIRALRDETGGTWKTFPLSADALNVNGWTQNAIVLPDVWLDAISYSGTSIKDAIMIVIPKWTAAGAAVTACTFAQTEGSACPILRGNILLVRFGSNGKISAYFSLPASDVDSIAQFKNIAGKLVTADLVTTGNKQTADPTSAEDIVGGVGGAGGESDSGAWWHFSGRGLFLKFFYTATASALFKLYRGAEGWLMSGLAKISTIAIDISGALSAQTANFSSTVSVKNLVNSGTTENTGSVHNAGNVLNDGNSTTIGISKLKGNALNAGMLASFSQAQSAARVAITEVSVPAGSKVLFFERHHSASSANHALGLYTNLADGASYVDSETYTEVGDVSATFAYTNSTENAVTLYFMIGNIEEGNTISYTNIHWNYLFL